MPNNKIFSRNEFFYLQTESTFGVIPNSSGTATVAASNACAMIQFKITRQVDTAARKDKTGSLSVPAGTATRQIAGFSSNMSLVTNGVAGTAPDCDPMFRSLFGAAPTSKSGTVAISSISNATPRVVTFSGVHGMASFDCLTISGVTGATELNDVWAVNVLTTTTAELIGSVAGTAAAGTMTSSKAALVYIPTDSTPISFAGWSFRTPSTAAQRVVGGCMSREGTFNLGEDIATWQNQGPALWSVDSINFSAALTAEKMGLTSFPTQPVSPVTNGGAIAGFKGLAALNGVAQARIRTAQIKYSNGADLPRDLFGTGMADSPEMDERSVQATFSMYEDDSAAQAALEQASVSKAGLDMVYKLGTVPGSIYVMVLRGVQLASPDRDDSQRAFTMNYSNSRAYGSGITSFNEMRLWAI
jgi:hypothetical protein